LGITLDQNTPNPFHAFTRIAYNAGGRADGVINIYDVNGKLVYSAAVAGNGALVWNAYRMISGVYLCRLTSGARTLTQKMVLMR
jgi:hypothetical protein